jgi:hypothetical protein
MKGGFHEPNDNVVNVETVETTPTNDIPEDGLQVLRLLRRPQQAEQIGAPAGLAMRVLTLDER